VLAAAGKARIHGVDRALIGERTSLIAPTGIWWISQAPSAAVEIAAYLATLACHYRLTGKFKDS